MNTSFVVSIYPIYVVFAVPVLIQLWALYSLWEDLKTGDAWADYAIFSAVIWVPFYAGYLLGRY